MLAPLLLASQSLATSQAPASSSEVPFVIAHSSIVVDGKVNGRPVSLMFDTGFGGVVLLSSSIDVGPPTGQMTLRDFVGELHAETVNLNSIQVGSTSLSPDEKVIVKQPANFSGAYGRHVDGILGFGSLKNKVVKIDFEHKKFVFYPSSYDISKLTQDGKKTFLSKLLPIGGNAMELAVTTAKGETMTMALDTGNGFYATTHRDVLERVGLWDNAKKPSFMRESGVASGAVDSWSCRMPDLNIFGVPVKPTVWDIIDLPSSDVQGDGTVGFGFLSHFNITFDYGRRRVWLEKWDDPVENDELGDLGLSAHYDRESKRTAVMLVAPGSPADEAGVKVDDELLSIDGVDIEHPTFDEMRHMLEGKVGSEVKLAISRNGNLKRVTLTRKSLVNQAN